jgi:dihydroxyacid dehydratase/phosphogluconate dehydratase
MTLDIAMGGSTNTVLHLLAIAYEGKVDFTMDDIDRLSRACRACARSRLPVANVHMEDVHRAGGIFGILGELDRGGKLIHVRSHRPLRTLGEAIAKWDIMSPMIRRRHQLFLRRAGRRAHDRGLQPVSPLQGARHAIARMASSVPPNMPSRRMAASLSCSATSPEQAAS